jgi:hypothetical protein
MRLMRLRVIFFVGMLACAPTVGQAVVTVSAGLHTLIPNTPGQVIDILISYTEGEGVNALDLYIDINGGIGPAPVITGFNLQGAPTIWAAAATTHSVYGPPYEPPPPTLAFASGVFLNNSAANVPASGVLAQLEIDMTGIFGGTWVIRLENSDWGETVMGNSSGPLPFIREDGAITQVPEPASLVLALLASTALTAVGIRRRAHMAARCAA